VQKYFDRLVPVGRLLWLGENGPAGALLTIFDSRFASNAPTRWIAPRRCKFARDCRSIFFQQLRITGDSSRESVQHHRYLWDSFSNSTVHGLILGACHKIGANGFQPFNLRDPWRHRRLLVDQQHPPWHKPRVGSR
jgi:hypothetical protein